ncbi:type 2 lanthipeptide synthetase LanM family protein [Paenibacillus larvae]|nr:type 2 lanthipeptide synthetase LanM family protein [Paenibacillus larvae]MDT2236219.1 type 2 lanthipeptide synthetase LanM family protein [Paenibacillus larvae]
MEKQISISGTFEQRLRTESLTENQFNCFVSSLDLKIEAEAQRYYGDSDWVKVYSAAMSGYEQDALPGHNNHLGVAVYPFVVWACKEIRSFFAEMTIEVVQDDFIQDFAQGLTLDLMQFSQYSLILELNVAKLLNQLEGNDSKERFHSFVRTLSNKEMLLSFYSEYIVLARLLSIRTLYTVNNLKEAMNRFRDDMPELRSHFPFVNQAQLQKITLGIGDRHKKGNSVMCFHFTGGNSLIYKPKNLEVSVKFQEISAFIAELGLKSRFKFHHILPKGEYGWEELVEYKTCHNRKEVERYFYRYGALVGIAYLLRGIDFHYENVIAQGEHPQLIDLETIFHNRPGLLHDDHFDVALKVAFTETVMGSNLLPVHLFGTEQHKGLELSGLGGNEQETPFDVKQMEHINTDEMRVIRKKVMINGKSNRVTLQNQEIQLSDYEHHILQGFSDVCYLVCRSKPLIRQKIKDTFEHTPIRIIVRSTQKYSNLLMEANHPDYTRHQLEREMFIDSVWGYPIRSSEILRSEREDLLEGDIPLFTTFTDSLHLWDSRGRRILHVFKESSMDLVLSRLERLTPEEIRYQVSLMKSSLYTVHSDGEGTVPKYTEVISNKDKGVYDGKKEKWLEAAEHIGELLQSRAVIGQDEASWLTLVTGKNGWGIQEIPKNLYDGLAGVALFFAYLSNITGRSDYKELSIKSMNRALKINTNEKILPSGFWGTASLLYPVFQIQSIIEPVKEWNMEAEKIADLLKNLETPDDSYDFLGGSAGLAVLLVQAYSVTKDDRFLELAMKYGDHLCVHADRVEGIYTWKSKWNDVPLGGLAHGVIGIGYALGQLYHVTEESHFKEAALGALNYQNSLYDVLGKRWIDNRKHKNNQYCDSHWCNGVTGIGMAQLALWNEWGIGHPQMSHEVAQAAEFVFQDGSYSSYCLCHGLMGDAEFLYTAGKQLNEQKWTEQAFNYADFVSDQVLLGQGQVCGTPRHIETPGLFLGLSGIGYQLLRLAEPDIVPCVLQLRMKNT